MKSRKVKKAVKKAVVRTSEELGKFEASAEKFFKTVTREIKAKSKPAQQKFAGKAREVVDELAHKSQGVREDALKFSKKAAEVSKEVFEGFKAGISEVKSRKQNATVPGKKAKKRPVASGKRSCRPVAKKPKKKTVKE